MQTLKELIDQLPPELQREVRDFAEFLLEKHGRKPKAKLRFDWEALRSYLSNFQRKRGIVDATRGSMRLSPEDLQVIMEEEGVFET